MKNPEFRRSALFAFGCCLCLLQVSAPALGGAFRTWSGASATAGPNTQAGATASASDSWSRRVEYSSAYSSGGGGGYFVDAQGVSSASTGGSPDALLRVDTQASIGNPGTIGGVWINGGVAEASASWTNDVIVITPPTGSPVPDSIRLQFSLTFNPSQDQWRRDFGYGIVSAQANDKKISIFGGGGGSFGYDAKAFDSIVDVPDGG